MIAALKRILLTLLTNKDGRKVIGIILGIVLTLLLMPAIAMQAFFKSDLRFDSEAVIQSLSVEEVWRLREVDSAMKDIAELMEEKEMPGRTLDAQVIYILALSPNDSPRRLVSCFEEEQSDAALIANVNAAFGTNINLSEFEEVMVFVRANHIHTEEYVDVGNKNNLDLVTWAVNAADSGWGYVWGTYGSVLNESLLEGKVKQYPTEVGKYEDYIREHWLGFRTADCTGLIKGYSWYDPETGSISVGTNGMPDIGCDDLYLKSKEYGSISSIPEIPGLAVWKKGHIGIYVGNGEVVEAYTTKSGVIRSQLSDRGWTRWFKIPYINYVDEK